MEYKVILKSFEGPFDLLFHLIEKSEVDIYDIPISEIAEQYIIYIEQMEELDLEVTSEFLVMAATLLEIKSKLLLPVKEEEGEQLELEEADPREELVRRLLEYKKYKEAAKELKNRETLHSKIFLKPKEEIDDCSEDENVLEGVELSDIVKAFDKLMKKKSQKNEINFHEIQRDEISIEEGMNLIENKISKNEPVNFDDLFEDSLNRSNVVVIFIGILELIKLKKIKIYQNKNFGNIELIKYEGDIDG